jgi:hypothetical protein
VSDKRIPHVDHLAKTNPNVDGDHIREIGELIAELRREGVAPREYSLASPYETVREPRRTTDTKTE